jgi:uncharacterized protein (DUF1330 family)
MPIEPSQAQIAEIAALAEGDGDSPVVMLNLNRYRDRARYEDEVPGGGSREVSGREAYARYGLVATTVLERVGGRVLWHTESRRTVIGDESDRYDEVIAVWYPSIAAFVALATDAELLAARAHRVAALERAALVCCESGAEPLLTGVP